MAHDPGSQKPDFRASVSDADSDSSAVYPDTVAESDRGRTGSKNPQKKGRNVKMKLLEVENLTVQYPGSTNPACKVSFQVESGELAWDRRGVPVQGKATAMLSLMGILPEQVQITSEKLKQHGTKAMIFQDASASLNPLIRVGKQLTETILAHQRCTGKEARERAETTSG